MNVGFKKQTYTTFNLLSITAVRGGHHCVNFTLKTAETELQTNVNQTIKQTVVCTRILHQQ